MGFGERGEAPIVHVGRGEVDIAKGRRHKAVSIGLLPGEPFKAVVVVIPQAVVVKAVIGKQGAAVTVETIGALQIAAWVEFRHEEFEAAAFLVAKGVFSLGSTVEARVVGCLREEKLLDGDSDPLGSEKSNSKSCHLLA